MVLWQGAIMNLYARAVVILSSLCNYIVDSLFI